MKSLTTVLSCCLSLAAFGQAATQAQPAAAPAAPPAAPNCKPAEPARLTPVPVGGSPASARDFSRPAAVTAIPGVVAEGATWSKVWQQGGNSADGIVPDKDGNILLAQEDYDQAIAVSPDGKVTTAVPDAWGLSSLSMDKQGRLYGVSRTERPGSTKPHRDRVVNAVVQLTPSRRTVADKWTDGGVLTVRPNDLTVDSNGGAYFTSGCVYYAAPAGVSVVAENIATNGIVLSADEKTLFVTNRSAIEAFDVAGPGRLANRRTFGRIPETDSGDGIALDSEGRLYVTTVSSPKPGVHVFDRTGKYLGLIPTPRPVISLAFGGPGKKTLFVVGSGADDERGQMIRIGPQQTAATLYKLPMLASGMKERAK